MAPQPALVQLCNGCSRLPAHLHFKQPPRSSSPAQPTDLQASAGWPFPAPQGKDTLHGGVIAAPY
eukprot:1950766-Rhodomonas_salina.5